MEPPSGWDGPLSTTRISRSLRLLRGAVSEHLVHTWRGTKKRVSGRTFCLKAVCNKSITHTACVKYDLMAGYGTLSRETQHSEAVEPVSYNLRRQDIYPTGTCKVWVLNHSKSKEKKKSKSFFLFVPLYILNSITPAISEGIHTGIWCPIVFIISYPGRPYAARSWHNHTDPL